MSMEYREYREKFLAELKKRYSLDEMDVDEAFIESTHNCGYEPAAAVAEFGEKYDLEDIQCW